MNEEQKREAANLWYERFGKDRESQTPHKRQRLMRLALLGAALLMVVVGLQLRTEKMNRAMGMKDGQEPEAWTRRLSSDLQLEAGDARLFFPYWETWLRRESEVRLKADRLRGRLGELGRGHSDHNQAQAAALEQLIELDSLRYVAGRELLEGVRGELGLWRASVLAQLMEEYRRASPD